MKLAVISDIHSNLPALQEVLKEVQSEEVDMLLCLGDIVGYGPFPNRTVEVLRKIKTEKIFVRGNHDDRVLEGKTERLSRDAERAVQWTKKHINEKNLRFLRKLDRTEEVKIGNSKVFLAHGSPRKPLSEYIYESTEEELLESFFRMTNSDVILLGHTHVPFIREVGGNLILNPGSVGQPRDGDNRTSYAILDTENWEINQDRTEYDVEKVAGEIKRSRLPSSLAQRLYHGS